MKLLHIDTSVLGENSVSRQLGAAAVDTWRRHDPRLEVRHRDLDRDPVPHLSSRTLSGEDATATAMGDTVLQEFIDADVVVIGVPFYNFGIPSTLKAWIDRIAVAGKTFRYTQDGPQGLAGGKRVILAIASGGPHAGTPRDFAEPYLRTLLGFLGIDDIQVVRAEGVAISPEHRTAAVSAALAAIPQPMPLAA
jgi:FMN-dependent NADH-azoreductase